MNAKREILILSTLAIAGLIIVNNFADHPDFDQYVRYLPLLLCATLLMNNFALLLENRKLRQSGHEPASKIAFSGTKFSQVLQLAKDRVYLGHSLLEGRTMRHNLVRILGISTALIGLGASYILDQASTNSVFTNHLWSYCLMGGLFLVVSADLADLRKIHNDKRSFITPKTFAIAALVAAVGLAALAWINK